jgi:hypothetical protein
MKYIVSFTTTPTRMQKLKPMLLSIVNQSRKPDLIILNIPKIFSRTEEKYNVPKYISRYAFVNIIDEDLGPATKIIPTIKYLNDNAYEKHDTRIIYLDDDVKYLNKMIECYEKNIDDRDDSFWASTGFDIRDGNIKHKRNHNDICTIVEGYGGVCVKLSIFDQGFFEYIDKYILDIECKLSDDVILSNYYSFKKIQIKILCVQGEYSIKDLYINGCILKYGDLEDALHNGAGNTSGNTTSRYHSVILKLQDASERHFPVFATT